MSRLIDADALIPMMKYATTDSVIGVFPIKIGFNDIEKVINEQPTIEPEPDIIHCGECRYYIHKDNIESVEFGKCLVTHAICLCEDYCSWAERKEGES